LDERLLARCGSFSRSSWPRVDWARRLFVFALLLVFVVASWAFVFRRLRVVAALGASSLLLAAGVPEVRLGFVLSVVAVACGCSGIALVVSLVIAAGLAVARFVVVRFFGFFSDLALSGAIASVVATVSLSFVDRRLRVAVVAVPLGGIASATFVSATVFSVGAASSATA